MYEMITEGETLQARRMAEDLGKTLNADYCFIEMDEHENLTLVLKYGEFNDDTSASEMVEHIVGE